MSLSTLRLALLACLVAATATAVTAGTVALVWDPNPEPDVVAYELFRLDPGTPPVLVSTTLHANERVLDEVAAGDIYAVRAVNWHGVFGPLSETVTIQPGDLWPEPPATRPFLEVRFSRDLAPGSWRTGFLLPVHPDTPQLFIRTRIIRVPVESP